MLQIICEKVLEFKNRFGIRIFPCSFLVQVVNQKVQYLSEHQLSTAMDSGDEPYFGESCGQKVDLTARIREILKNYPEGRFVKFPEFNLTLLRSILKELIQNADDAGARRCSICFDKRTFGTKTLWNTKLVPFQGPAIYVYKYLSSFHS